MSPALLSEYREVPLLLRAKGKINHFQLKALVSGIASVVSTAKIVYPQERAFICRDAEDNMVLECCIEAKANILISGDKDLLDLKELLSHLKILTPRTFIEEM